MVTSTQSTSGETDYKPTVPDPVADVIRTDFTGIEKVAQFHGYYAKVTVPVSGNETKKFDAANEREEQTSDIIISDAEYFDIFKYKWLAGSVASMKEPFHIVLSESKAKKYFGALQPDEIIGKKIFYNDSLALFVSGIIKDYPKNSDLRFTDFISSATIQRSFLKDDFPADKWQRWNKISQTFVKVAVGKTPVQFQKQTLSMVAKNMDLGDETKVNILLQPLADIHFNINYAAAYGREVNLSTLYGLMMIAIFILLIAAINFINLSTAQSFQRAKEVGVRKVLGSSRKNLIVQFLCETFILTAISIIISLLAVSPVISAFHSFLPDGVQLSFNPTTIIFILLVTLIITLLAGFYPAKILSAYVPVLTLKGANFQQSGGKNYLRKGLIVFQFTISLIFIIGTLIIGNQIKFVLHTNMGFAKNAIITIPGNQNYPKEKMQVLAQQIKSLSGVKMVSVDLGTPAEESHWSTVLKSKELGDAEVSAEFQAGDENYLQLYQLKLLAGRNVLASDTMKEYLINETLAKQLGFKNPENAIGHTISSGGDDGTTSHKMLPIVGVLADFHTGSLHDPIAPTFISTSKKYSRIISVKLSANGEPAESFKSTTAQIEKLWKELYQGEKFEYKFFDATIAKFYDKELKTDQLMNIAMVIAILISCMGLFGLAIFEAQKRSKEIGIRKVMGASVFNIVSMFSWNFSKLILLAFIIASPVAYYCMHQWLQNFAYRVNVSVWVFVLSVAAAMLIALITISFQAIKAAIANPVKSLRTE